MHRLLPYLFILLLLVTGGANSLAQSVSQNINQLLSFDYEPDNPPSTLYVKTNTSVIDVKRTRGSRVLINGKVRLGIPNLFFLDVLIKRGRYLLYLSADGANGLRLEDKTKPPMILKGEQCSEEIFYTIYVPYTIKTVVLEDRETGMTDLVEFDRPLASSDSGPQVTIKDK